MNDSRAGLNETAARLPEFKNRSTGALVLFVILALLTPVGMLIYHYVLWYLEQLALASGSFAPLAWAGPIGLVVQGILLTAIITSLWRLTKDERFRPVYAGWLGAALMAFPGLIFRFLGPNNDQLGSILQISICGIAAIIFARVRKPMFRVESNRLWLAFFLAAFGVAPFAIYGALGSPTDTILNFFAGLSLGLLAASLMESTTGSRFLDALGIGTVLTLLGSAIGYDGAQLILLAILPSFGFAIVTVMPSRLAAAILTGLLAAAGLIFFDPTELAIIVGDVFPFAQRAVSLAVGLGLLVGIIALLIQDMTEAGQGRGKAPVLGVLSAVAIWVLVFVLYFATGNRGFYGDRLFVIMKDQANLSDLSQIQDIDERRTAAYQTLTEHANETQAGLRNTFDTFGVDYTPYYLVNAMEVRGGTLIRLFLSARPEVDRVIPSPRLRPVPEESAPPEGGGAPPQGVQWNVRMVGADKVWSEFGVRGEGIVVGQSDSGVDGNHPDLRDSYRGKTKGDDYNWFDPWEGKPSPHDDSGHGTHTLGTVLGQNGIGIAPGATWFACVNLDRILANPAFYLDCLQFMLAPFPQGSDPFTDGDPTRAADVLNNSWGCPEIEGCDPNALLPAANNLRAAGIFLAVSAGNDGPSCGTVDAPLSIYDSVFSVGAIDRSGNVTEFSSRGPVIADGSGRIKPDIVAPGRDILSSVPGGNYASYEGTSMAGPHVAGAVALLWSADPSLIGDIDHTEQLLIRAADPYKGSTAIGCFEGDVPNAAYGYGYLDVYEAVKEALGR